MRTYWGMKSLRQSRQSHASVNPKRMRALQNYTLDVNDLIKDVWKAPQNAVYIGIHQQDSDLRRLPKIHLTGSLETISDSEMETTQVQQQQPDEIVQQLPRMNSIGGVADLENPTTLSGIEDASLYDRSFQDLLKEIAAGRSIENLPFGGSGGGRTISTVNEGNNQTRRQRGMKLMDTIYTSRNKQRYNFRLF